MTNRTWPRIAVVGAGALGCYFGAVLARAGLTVTLIGRQSHVDAINRDGLLFRSGDFEQRVPIAATTDIAAVNDAKLILLCVKSSDTEGAVAKMARHLQPGVPILSLQNGVDNAERIRLHTANPAIPVLVYVGANVPAPGSVQHTGGGHLVMGQTAETRNDESRTRLIGEVAALFRAAGIAVKISEDLEVDLWTKLVMNCAYNAISALSGANYGQMVASAEVRGVMRDAVQEVVRVAHAKNIRLPGNIVDAAMSLADAMPRTTSSTAQDIAKGKRTEIDHLNGYIVREGEMLGIPTPVNRTLTVLMKLLEQTRLNPKAS
jgi:2-dehydropantoate 2-reductase